MYEKLVFKLFPLVHMSPLCGGLTFWCPWYPWILCAGPRTVSYRIVSYRTVPYRTVPYRTVPYRTVSYRIVSYRAVPQDSSKTKKKVNNKFSSDYFHI